MDYPPYWTTHDDFDDDDNFQRCRHCGATYVDDIDEADHAGDCPSNPCGYNHPEGVKYWTEFWKETEESDREKDQSVQVMIQVFD